MTRRSSNPRRQEVITGVELVQHRRMLGSHLLYTDCCLLYCHETNRIRLGNRGVVPVAVLGSEEFDAARIDPETLSFGPNGARPIGSHGGVRLDVNHDGFMDWVANFRIEETGIAFGEEMACIEGKSIDRRSFHGCDAIVTTFGCGHGFEMALAIPPLLWSGGRIRRRHR